MIKSIYLIKISIIQLFCLLIFVILSYFFSNNIINKLYPILLIIFLLWPLFYYIRFIESFLFLPIVYFSLTCCIYYGLGPLIYIYGSNESIKYLDSYYFVNPIDLKNTNILNLFSIFLVLFFYTFFLILYNKNNLS